LADETSAVEDVVIDGGVGIEAGVSSNKSVNYLMQTGKFKDAFDILKKLILHPQHPKNLKYIARHKIKIADTIEQAAHALNQLKRFDEIDELLEQALLIYKNDWRVLEQITITYNSRINHTGQIIDNKFTRLHETSRYFSTEQYDNTRALIIFSQAVPLVLQDKNKNDAAKFFVNMADILYDKIRSYPHVLTDITKLPNYNIEPIPHNYSYGKF
jgi:tetratricopeptide (TPR) repeat protein